MVRARVGRRAVDAQGLGVGVVVRVRVRVGRRAVDAPLDEDVLADGQAEVVDGAG